MPTPTRLYEILPYVLMLYWSNDVFNMNVCQIIWGGTAKSQISPHIVKLNSPPVFAEQGFVFQHKEGMLV